MSTRRTKSAGLLEAALEIESPHQLQPHTYHCLFGLLAVSGLRLGEAINLQPQDVDWSEGVLTIRGAKFGKITPRSRCILRRWRCCVTMPIGATQLFTGRILPTFLVTSHGTKLEKTESEPHLP